MSNQKQYKAFISYSRKDEKYVKKLHTMLETYIIPQELHEKYPNLPKKLSPIFRDIEQLKSGDKLPKEILKKLTDSENLIVVCSPRSAKSEWVDKEIIDFKKMYGEDRIFPIIIDGIPHTNDENECFSEALKYKVNEKGELTDTKTDILASNIIKSADGKRFAEVKLISGLLGVENDDLWNFEEKRTKKKRLFWGSVWSVVFFMMVGLTILSWIQRDRAIENEQKAIKTRLEAERLVEYNLYDLTKELKPIGKLKLLKNVYNAVDKYYKNIGNDENNPEVLHRIATYNKKLGDYYMDIEDFKKAKKLYLQSMKIVEQINNINPNKSLWINDLVVIKSKIADSYIKGGQIDEANKLYEESFSLMKKLRDIEPYNIEWLRDMAVAHERLADKYKRKNEIIKMKEEYEKALDIRKLLIKLQPKKIEYKRELSVIINQLGNYYMNIEDLNRSKIYYQQLLQLLKTLNKINPNNTVWKRDLANSYSKMGDFYKKIGKTKEMIENYQNSLTIMKELNNIEPNRAMWKRDLAVCYSKLGDIYVIEKKITLAISHYQQVLKIIESLSNKSSNIISYQVDKIELYYKLSTLFQNNQKNEYKEKADNLYKSLIQQNLLSEEDKKYINDLKLELGIEINP